MGFIPEQAQGQASQGRSFRDEGAGYGDRGGRRTRRRRMRRWRRWRGRGGGEGQTCMCKDMVVRQYGARARACQCSQVICIRYAREHIGIARVCVSICRHDIIIIIWRGRTVQCRKAVCPYPLSPPAATPNGAAGPPLPPQPVRGACCPGPFDGRGTGLGRGRGKGRSVPVGCRVAMATGALE